MANVTTACQTSLDYLLCATGSHSCLGSLRVVSKSETTGWQRYRSGDVILEFDAPVAAVSPRGEGRMTRSQFLRDGDLFCYLPPFPGQQKEMPRG